MDRILDKYRCIVCGYIRTSQNLLTDTSFLYIIPIEPISYLILIYYYPIPYQWDKYDERLWQIVDNKSTQTILRGTTNFLSGSPSYLNGYGVYIIQSNIFNVNTSNKIINDSSMMKTLSVKAINTYYQRKHSIGIVTETWSSYSDTKFVSCYDGRSGYHGYWRTNETVTVLLNCKNWKITYYKTDKMNNDKIIKIKQESVTPNEEYKFALYAHPDAAYLGHAEYQIVENPDNLNSFQSD